MAEREAQFSLADLGEIDMNQVPEHRFTVLPMGAYTFQIKDARLDAFGDEETPIIDLDMEVVDTHGLVKVQPEDEENYKGVKHRERFFIKQAEDLGRFRAFINDSKVPVPAGVAKLVPVLEMMKEHVFSAKIGHRPDKNDKSIVYARVKFDPVKEKKLA